MLDSSVFARVAALFQFSEALADNAEVPSENKLFFRTVKLIQGNLEECQRLYNNPKVGNYISNNEPEKKQWIKSVVEACFVELDELEKYVPHQAVDTKDCAAIVKWAQMITNDQSKLDNKRTALTFCHTNVLAVISYLDGLCRSLDITQSSRLNIDGTLYITAPTTFEGAERLLSPPSYDQVVEDFNDFWTPYTRRKQRSKGSSKIANKTENMIGSRTPTLRRERIIPWLLLQHLGLAEPRLISLTTQSIGMSFTSECLEKIGSIGKLQTQIEDKDHLIEPNTKKHNTSPYSTACDLVDELALATDLLSPEHAKSAHHLFVHRHPTILTPGVSRRSFSRVPHNTSRLSLESMEKNPIVNRSTKGVEYPMLPELDGIELSLTSRNIQYGNAPPTTSSQSQSMALSDELPTSIRYLHEDGVHDQPQMIKMGLVSSRRTITQPTKTSLDISVPPSSIRRGGSEPNQRNPPNKAIVEMTMLPSPPSSMEDVNSLAIRVSESDTKRVVTLNPSSATTRDLAPIMTPEQQKRRRRRVAMDAATNFEDT